MSDKKGVSHNSSHERRVFSPRGGSIIATGLLSFLVLVMIFSLIIARADPEGMSSWTLWKTYSGHDVFGNDVSYQYFDVFQYQKNLMYAENLNPWKLIGLADMSWFRWPEDQSFLEGLINVVIAILNLNILLINLLFIPVKLIAVVNMYICLIIGVTPNAGFFVSQQWIYDNLQIPPVLYVNIW